MYWSQTERESWSINFMFNHLLPPRMCIRKHMYMHTACVVLRPYRTQVLYPLRTFTEGHGTVNGVADSLHGMLMRIAPHRKFLIIFHLDNRLWNR